MQVTLSRNGNTLTAQLHGRLEGLSSIDFQQTIESEMDPGDTGLILDMHDMSYLGSAGLRVLAILSKRTGDAGVKFALCAPQQTVKRVIGMSGFDKMISIFGTQEEANAAVSA